MLPKEEIFRNRCHFPLDFTTIAKHQKKDNELKKLLKNKLKKNEFRQVNFNLVALWTVINTKNDNQLIYVPYVLRSQLLDLYHKIIKHPGVDRMSLTVRQHFEIMGSKKDIHDIVRICDACQ